MHITGEELKMEERKKVEEELKESEIKYRSLVEDAGAGVATTDWKGRFTFVNKALCRMIGYSGKELIGKPFADFLHPDDKKKILKIFWTAFTRPKREVSLEFRVVHKKGHIVHMYSTPTITLYKNKVIGFNAIITDITERKQMEEALRKSREKYRSIVELAPDGIVAINIKGVITSANPAFLRLTGFSKNEIVGKHFTKLGTIRAGDIPKYMKLFTSTLRGKLPPPIEFVYFRKDGTQRWGEAHSGLMKKDGKTVGFQVILRDITERKKAEETLRESEEKYRTQFEEALDAILVADAETGIIIDCNRAASELVGREKSELIGKHQRILHPPQEIEGEFSRTFKQHVKEKEGQVLEAQVITKKGEIKDVAIKANVFELEGKNLIQGIFRDITERKKAEEELIRLSSAVKTSTDSIVISDIGGKILDVNEATLKMYGSDDKEDLIGKNSFNLIAPEEREKALAGAKDLLEKGYLKIRAYHILTKNGNRIPVEMSAAIMKDTDGKPIGFVGISRDITERKQTEEKLRESEERFRNLFESADDGILTVDLHGRVTSANKKIEEISGLSREKIIGKLPTQFGQMGIIGLKDMPLIIKALKTRIKGQPSKVYDFKIKNKKGQEKFIEFRSSLIKKMGKPIGILEIVRDVTERKKAEEKVRESEEKYKSIFENAGDAIVTFDLKGNVTSANKAVFAEYGFKENEFVGKNMLKFVPKKYWSRLLKELADIARGNPTEGELEIFTPRGKRIADYRNNPIRQGKEIVGFQTILRDITERKMMEEKLRQYSEHLEELVQKRTEELLESETRYSTLVEEASDGVAIVQDEKIVFTNKRLLEIVGYSRDELIGLPLEKAVDKKYLQQVKEDYERGIRGEKVPTTFELEIIAKTGERALVEASSTFINYKGRPAVLILVRDISERKRIEEEHLKLEKLAAIGELATMVGHDLRNPLQSIENAAYVLTNEMSQCANTHSVSIPQKAKEMLQVINNSVNYADKIIKDLQDFSAPQKPRLKKTNINTIVKETLSQFETPKNVKLITELNSLPEIKADKDMTKRVFLNLTINGIQAMKNGGTLKISSKKTRDFVEVSFKDTGIGMPKEKMGKIFTPFFTTKAKGMGMGLPICKKFVDAHHGNIAVESEEGKGTTFTVKLPIQ